MEFELVSREDLGERLLGTSPSSEYPFSPSSSSSIPVTLYIGRDFAHLLSDQSELVPFAREKAQCVVRFPNGVGKGFWLQWIAALFSLGTMASICIILFFVLVFQSDPHGLLAISFGSLVLCPLVTIFIHVFILGTIDFNGRFRFLKQHVRSRPIYFISTVVILISNISGWEIAKHYSVSLVSMGASAVANNVLIVAGVFLSLIFPLMDLSLIISKRSRILSLSFGATGIGLAFLPTTLHYYLEFLWWQNKLKGDEVPIYTHWELLESVPLWYTGFWALGLLFQSSFVVSILAMVWRKRKGSNFPSLGFSIPDAFKVEMGKGEDSQAVIYFDKMGVILANRDMGSSTRPFLVFSRESSGKLFVLLSCLLSCLITSLLIIANIGGNFPVILRPKKRSCFIPPTVRVAPLLAAKLAMCAFTFLVAFFYVLLSLRGHKLRSLLLYSRFFWLENRLFAFLTAVFLAGTVIYSFIGDPIRIDKLPPFEVLLLPVFDLFLVISPRDSRVARWLFRLLFFCFMLDAELRYLVRGIDNNSCEKLEADADNPTRSITAKSLLGSLLFSFYGAWLSRWHAVCGRKCRNPQDPGSAWQRTSAKENIVDIRPNVRFKTY